MKSYTFTNQVSRAALLLVMMAVFGVGCAKKSDSGSSSADTTTNTNSGVPTTPRGDGDAQRGSDWAAGATAALSVDAGPSNDPWQVLNYYAATHPVNNPSDVRISVKLNNVGSATVGQNKMAGQVFVSYFDNGQYYTGKFFALDKTNPTGNLSQSGTYYPGWHHAAYNTWFIDPRTGKKSFHGFYQDSYGVVMLIINDLVDQGDGAGANYATGSIWFKNFAQSQYDECGNYHGTKQIWPIGTASNCQGLWVIPSWFRLTGPYDTRTFLENANNGDGNVVTTSVLFPSESHYYTNNNSNPYIEVAPARGWRRLGTFSGLNKAKAFSE